MLIARLRRRLIAIFRPRIQAAVLAFSTRVATDGGTYKDNGGDERALWASMGLEPSLVLTPSAFKAAKLYALEPSDGSGDFTVDRASSATYVDENGVIQTAAANEPRIDHSSGEPVLLVEGQATNLLTYSEDFLNLIWEKTNSNINSNSLQAPDATITADKLTDTAGLSYTRVRQTFNGESGKKYTFSVFLKKAELRYTSLWLSGNAFNVAGKAYIDLNTGSVVSTSNLDNCKVEAFSNGCFRVSITATTVASGTATCEIFCTSNESDITYNAVGSGGVYIWGAQLEQGSRATSYIPTAGTTVTRLKDVIKNAGNTNVISSDSGALFIDSFLMKNSETSSVYIKNSATGYNNMVAVKISTAGRFTALITGGGTNNSGIYTPIGVDYTGNKIKCIITWDLNVIRFFKDGTKIGEVNMVNQPVGLDQISLCNSGIDTETFKHLTKNIKVFKKALSAADCIRLTS